MIYKSFRTLSISHLGLGNMRLPTGKDGRIDEEKARRIIEYAYENGVNYFDTAYRYHGGESEPFVGKVLKQYPRDSWYLASKMPGHMMKLKDGKLEFIGYLTGLQKISIEEIFEEQLVKCGVDYFDFYLVHNVCETSIDLYMDEDLGVVKYLRQQKEAGRIRYLGFSAHGSADTIERFLNWDDGFDFAQIQLNYLDWKLQNAKRKYEILTERGIPVIVMEPVRGGKLAVMEDAQAQLLKAVRPEDSIASWAFRFVKSLPGVLTVLSGMTQLDQAEDNVKTFSDPTLLMEKESAAIEKVVSQMADLVPCTACKYCCEGCPAHLDIPNLIAIYNELSYGQSAGLGYAIDALKADSMPSNCIACGNCTMVCPQGIDIPDVMVKLQKGLEGVK